MVDHSLIDENTKLITNIKTGEMANLIENENPLGADEIF
jgi:hypothetical protein